MHFKLFWLTVMAVNVKNSDAVQAQIPNASKMFDSVLDFWYPHDAEFNERCVSDGCPALKNFSLCPKEINTTVLHRVLRSAIGCMREPICGTVMDNRPIPNFNFTTEDWLPDLDLDGIAELLPGEGYVTNVSNIEFDLIADHLRINQLPLRITMFTSNFRGYGVLKLDLKLRKMLPSILGPALSATFSRIRYELELEYVATISLNHSLSGDKFDLKLLNPILKNKPSFCDIAMPEGFPSIQSLIISMTQTISEKSSWAVRKAAFWTKYFQSVFDAVLNSC